MDSTLPVYSVAGAPEALALRAGPPASVRAALLAARRRTLDLADDFRAALGDAYPGIGYAPELNPPLWELGHVAWFQEWWIGRNRQRARGVACEPDHAREPSLLPQADAWYDSSRVAHRTRWALPLPDAEATRGYLERTFAQTLALLDELPPDAHDDALYFFRLVALHEAMHAEAAAYMAEGLGISLREGGPGPRLAEDAELELPARRFRIGSEAGAGFAFDNELLPHDVAIEPLRIDAQAVSWARFLPFVEAGGYESPAWWSDAGRDWLAHQPLRHPACLRAAGTGWQQRRGGCWLPLDPQAAAVHLNAHEAEAWCRWAGRRLPTEAEWECAALTLPGFAWGRVWEWTSSPFEPYPGFTPHPYRDYSAPWFGTRRVLRGACHATSAALAHARYRNFFEPHRRDIFAGFRSCRAAGG
ncbi:SUMF1/EgtB/PvdO family nonheme iron enzyme [Variovorax paradoxus]|uniref:selenoneine synthase SenA n=1 Tax=Variovorax paradoxus TaxID=34073 RepID=UPI00399C2EAE